ncbi:hypothetical protein IW140_005964 [Coemansia sp. RSA 1813]|nr:hypothetical protein EV178_005987 [Coemansia sp. RSA 1646]KAJ1767426.1 hypothetical protein LPJ74_005373 [Coemansia sp. RSA 1843]KAJ2086069.1 hypothetical protein IW138_005927 [Coemansia sp. RSA 986]KAJ2210853.1 hypothetical protein EV179_005938 [Coemansia sp. RSA 487]KAJ2563819.1 hypothetical protein IW140_005964 [Coemansia sp. RSA 1813]
MGERGTLNIPPEPSENNSQRSLDYTMATLVNLRAKIDANKDSGNSEPAESHSEGYWYEWGNMDNETERISCKQWVARIARLSTTRWMDSPSEAAKWEPAMELAYDVMSLLNEYGVPKQNYKHTALWNSDGSRVAKNDGGIYVQEVGFVQADLGGETWDSSVVLARRIARGAINVSRYRRCIELGCGTGLLGFTVAHVFAESSYVDLDNATKSDKTVVMTDYLPTIMNAVEEGVKKNGFFDLGLVRPALMDWFDIAEQAQLMKDRGNVPIPAAHYLDESEINRLSARNADGNINFFNRLDPTESKGSFDLVVAADILYEVEQCLVIPRLVDFLLAPAPEDISSNDDIVTVPKFVVTTSLRSTHWAEVSEFEAEMAKITDLVLVSKEDASRLSDMTDWIGALSGRHADTVEDGWVDVRKAMEQDEGDSRQYRTYVFERQVMA